jgi:uncharacterized protein YyaL (SSP411 family)
VSLLLLVFLPIGCSPDTAEGESNMINETQSIENYTFTNRLIDESSPYLLQHAHNPVDWYPWSDEAFDKARREDKPIFLSIGYAACHWCHVMEEESFENEDIAKILNDGFVSVKVDREQRPDLDQIYMAATIAMTGSGGWPMTLFLTPDLKPFFAGTYFPPTDGYGRPGFKRLLTEIANAYATQRQKIEQLTTSLLKSLEETTNSSSTVIDLDNSVVRRAADDLLQGFDKVNGGFGGAPKFPHPSELSFLLKVFGQTRDANILEAIEHSLKSMARGGIYDQLGGGFHRYSTDARWLVPHFEKMLYDNALLAVTYSEAYQVTKNEPYRKIVRETLDFMIREMQHKRGGFYSSLDADSEGEEGRFYVWHKSEISELLGDDSDVYCSYFNITDRGNFESGTNIPHITSVSDASKAISKLSDEEFVRVIDKNEQILMAERSKRIRPATDDKILTSWNGLAISGMSRGYQITRDNRYRDAALKAATFIRDSLYENGQLVHSYRLGKSSEGVFLEDYAYLTQGFIDLYEVVYDYQWIEFASQLATDAARLFSNHDGDLFLSPAGQEDHFMRPKDVTDGALPAPGSILIQSLLKLADITGNRAFQKQAEKSLAAVSNTIVRAPSGMTAAVTALGYLDADKIELILVGKEDRESFLDEVYSSYLPNRVIVVSDSGDEDIALLQGRQSNGKTVAYVCRNLTCKLPAETPVEFKKQLAEITTGY